MTSQLKGPGIYTDVRTSDVVYASADESVVFPVRSDDAGARSLDAEVGDSSSKFGQELGRSWRRGVECVKFSILSRGGATTFMLLKRMRLTDFISCCTDSAVKLWSVGSVELEVQELSEF